MDDFVSKYSKWLVSNNRCSLWVAYSEFGVPPEFVLDHIVNNDVLLKNVVAGFLEDTFEMSMEDIKILIDRKVFLDNLQRSWFDPFYDNMNVEIQKQEWMDEKIKEKQVQDVGNMKNEAGEIVAHIYAPLFDIYEKNGGREHVEKVVKRMFNLKDDE